MSTENGSLAYWWPVLLSPCTLSSLPTRTAQRVRVVMGTIGNTYSEEAKPTRITRRQAGSVTR